MKNVFLQLLLLLSIVFEQTPSRYIPVQRPSVLWRGAGWRGGGSTRLPRTVYREILAIRDTLVHFDCSLGSTPPRRARGYMMSIYLIVKPPGWVTFSLGGGPTTLR